MYTCFMSFGFNVPLTFRCVTDNPITGDLLKYHKMHEDGKNFFICLFSVRRSGTGCAAKLRFFQKN